MLCVNLHWGKWASARYTGVAHLFADAPWRCRFGPFPVRPCATIAARGFSADGSFIFNRFVNERCAGAMLRASKRDFDLGILSRAVTAFQAQDLGHFLAVRAAHHLVADDRGLTGLD